MKKLTLIQITLVLMLAESVFSYFMLNNLYHFSTFNIDQKYSILAIIIIGMHSAFQIFYGFTRNSMSEKTTKTHYLYFYGNGSYNFLYIYHHLAFSLIMFHTSFYALSINALTIFIFLYDIRSTQNNFSEQYELDILKEEAKTKPTVTLD